MSSMMLVPVEEDDFAWILDDGVPAREDLRVAEGGLDEDVDVIRHIRALVLRMRAREACGHWMMVVDGEVVGLCGFHDVPSADGMVEIGYNVAPSRRLRGHATEAVACLVAIAAADERMTRVIATTDADNVGSQRALRRNGFERVDDVAGDDAEITWRAELRTAGVHEASCEGLASEGYDE